MTFHLAYADGRTLLDSDSPIIKAKDRAPFSDVIALLGETTRLRDQAETDAAQMRDAARQEALAEAQAATRELVETGLADLATRIEEHAESRRAEIAEAAFAAARAIVGELDDVEMMTRIVDRTLTKVDAEVPVTLDVAPSVADAIRAHVNNLKHVTITENPAFAPTDCHVLTASGRIIASLTVQFQALAARWGVSDAAR